ncbi:MAG: 50S ribosomal protein L29 [Saprospiraceae bacterium]|nr:50S ribosomal protein L29 [Saprospiraceae bacterium]
MASKKFIELQGMTVESISEELKAAQADLSRMRFDHASKGLENPLELKALRKDIARLQTELRDRALKSMTPEQLARRSKIRLRRK